LEICKRILCIKRWGDKDGNQIHHFIEAGYWSIFAPPLSDQEYYRIHQLVAEAFL
jgi:hypothetical protein